MQHCAHVGCKQVLVVLYGGLWLQQCSIAFVLCVWGLSSLLLGALVLLDLWHGCAELQVDACSQPCSFAQGGLSWRNVGNCTIHCTSTYHSLQQSWWQCICGQEQGWLIMRWDLSRPLVTAS